MRAVAVAWRTGVDELKRSPPVFRPSPTVLSLTWNLFAALASSAIATGFVPGSILFAARYAELICDRVRHVTPDGVPPGQLGSLAPFAEKYRTVPCPRDVIGI